ncbi:MAG TPA: IPT/TIG domain-containing protein, partial [Thermoanaerobaculia bacterium]|nr:IPT/TIG domain-containing protein [Thermoanaerobaculia bacterium]
ATIWIVTPDGFTFPIDITVVDGPAPSVRRIEPSSAPAAGGSSVTIVGEGLDARCSVSFGAAAGANVTAVSSGVGVVVPPHPPGTVDVSVVCGSARITLPNVFTFFVPRRRAAG